LLPDAPLLILLVSSFIHCFTVLIIIIKLCLAIAHSLFLLLLAYVAYFIIFCLQFYWKKIEY
jgi:hypothetical protein